jgi:hypothetical protein
VPRFVWKNGALSLAIGASKFKVFLKNVRRKKQKYKLFYWYGIVLYHGMVYKTLAGFHCMVTGKRVRSSLNTYSRIWSGPHHFVCAAWCQENICATCLVVVWCMMCWRWNVPRARPHFCLDCQLCLSQIIVVCVWQDVFLRVLGNHRVLHDIYIYVHMCIYSGKHGRPSVIYMYIYIYMYTGYTSSSKRATYRHWAHLIEGGRTYP